MSRRADVAAVYLAGLAQGLALVTFPAVSSVLTSPTGYGLSGSAYGALFLPQAVAAILASLLGARATGRVGAHRVLQLGLCADVVSMALLLASAVVMGQPLGTVLLLVATASLGIGFGLTVPSLNGYAAALFPERVGRATLYLNALLGLGTVLAPLLSALFLGVGAWWALPSLAGAALAMLLAATLRLPLTGGAGAPAEEVGHGRTRAVRSSIGSPPDRFWLFAAAALLYGVVETINGNWSTVYMSGVLGASASMATLALAAFWGAVTLGRILFAAIERWLPEATTYQALPFVAAVALLATALLPSGQPQLGVLAFGLAGLGCSALLPLTIGMGELELTTMGAAVAGSLIAAYQAGYGIAAFGVGPAESILGIGLPAVFALCAAIAALLGALAIRVVRGSPGHGRATQARVA
ncbi:MAG: MFS transporter [Chloroflexota bacterium]